MLLFGSGGVCGVGVEIYRIKLNSAQVQLKMTTRAELGKTHKNSLDPQATWPSLSPGLLMLETSTRATLSPRQACAVESGARQSGLGVNMVMTSPVLDLTDNTTCYLYNSGLNINFFYLNTSTIWKASMLSKFKVVYQF